MVEKCNTSLPYSGFGLQWNIKDTNETLSEIQLYVKWRLSLATFMIV